jgi:hypothetical protein
MQHQKAFITAPAGTFFIAKGGKINIKNYLQYYLFNFIYRLEEINWLWLAGIGAIVFVVVFALCLLAKCRFSMFTRHAKRKLHHGGAAAAAARKKSVKKSAEINTEEKGEVKENASAASKDDVLPVGKREYTLNVIDAALGLAAESFNIAGKEKQFQTFTLQDSIGEPAPFFLKISYYEENYKKSLYQQFYTF